jgi:hypothetical protein
MKGDRPTTPNYKNKNRSPKTISLKLSNKDRNRMNKNLETAGGV